jgi:ubiquinone biosynthesis protein UbiJ
MARANIETLDHVIRRKARADYENKVKTEVSELHSRLARGFSNHYSDRIERARHELIDALITDWCPHAEQLAIREFVDDAHRLRDQLNELRE